MRIPVFLPGVTRPLGNACMDAEQAGMELGVNDFVTSNREFIEFCHNMFLYSGIRGCLVETLLYAYQSKNLSG